MPRSRKTRWISSAFVGPVVALLVAGCSGTVGGSSTAVATTAAPASSATAPPRSATDPATEAALPSNSVGPIYTKDTFLPALKRSLPQPVTFHLEQEMTVLSNGVTQHLTASGDVHSDRLKSKGILHLAVDGDPVEMLFVDGQIYVNRHDATGNKWQLQDASDPQTESTLAEFRNNNPVQSLGSLGSANRLTFVGVEVIDGEDTNHYQAAFDGPVTTGTESSSRAELVYDLWLDGKSHVRQLSRKGTGFEYRQRFSKWGEPVNVTAPPLSEQTTAPAI